jgi:hypothetical protein
MNEREFSDIEIFQHSGKGIPLFMTGHKNCLQADYLLGPGPHLIKSNLPGRGLTKVEKHCYTHLVLLSRTMCALNEWVYGTFLTDNVKASITFPESY